MKNKKNQPDTDDHITKILNDPAKVAKILQAGIHDALLKHKQAGNSVYEWRNDKVVCVPPEEILVGK